MDEQFLIKDQLSILNDLLLHLDKQLPKQNIIQYLVIEWIGNHFILNKINPFTYYLARQQ